MFNFLPKQLKFMCLLHQESNLRWNQENILTTENYVWSDLLRSAEALSSNGMDVDSFFGIHPFYIEKGKSLDYSVLLILRRNCVKFYRKSKFCVLSMFLITVVDHLSHFNMHGSFVAIRTLLNY